MTVSNYLVTVSDKKKREKKEFKVDTCEHHARVLIAFCGYEYAVKIGCFFYAFLNF